MLLYPSRLNFILFVTVYGLRLHQRNMNSAGILHKRLGLIKGANDRTNEVIYSSPTQSSINRKRTVTVFFGGDVQDYPEAMQSHRDHGQYIEWSLPNVSELLAQKFPTHHIFVIKPKRMEIKTFSCYDNFVLSNNIGAPTHNSYHNSLIHLKTLLSEALNVAVHSSLEKEESELIKISKADSSDETGRCEVNSSDKHKDVRDESKMACDGDAYNSKNNIQSSSVETSDIGNPIVEYDEVNLIGFSKGCVVLNQLIHEMNAITLPDIDSSGIVGDFCKKISNMYWLDGGHSGGKETWITNRTVLTSLAARKNIKIHIHVTPYQVHDDQRPWIRRESKAFYDILRRNGASVAYKLHFKEEIPSLHAHFRLLKEFDID